MSIEVQLNHAHADFTLDVTFRAGSGVTALFGPSGAGKTSIANAIAGIFHPDRGRVVLGGRLLLDTATGVNLPPARRRIGYVFQDGRLFPHLSVADNMRFGARFAPGGLDKAEMTRITDLLGLMTLLKRRPGTLSGGEKQRVALARALLSRPELLIMDEPLAALDVPRKDEIFPYLERLRDTAQVPIIYVSHALEEVARLADDLVVLQSGRVAVHGPTEKVLSDPAALPFVGVREAGAILTAVVAEHGHDGLSRLTISGGELLLPGVTSPVGTSLRIRILAQDVILSLEAPKGLSSRNILPVTIEALHLGGGPGVAVRLRVGDDHLLARITSRAAEEMKLVPGLACFAILKATAVPRSDIGGGRKAPIPGDLGI